jgi:hypothetical protein
MEAISRANTRHPPRPALRQPAPRGPPRAENTETQKKEVHDAEHLAAPHTATAARIAGPQFIHPRPAQIADAAGTPMRPLRGPQSPNRQITKSP